MNKLRISTQLPCEIFHLTGPCKMGIVIIDHGSKLGIYTKYDFGSYPQNDPFS